MCLEQKKCACEHKKCALNKRNVPVNKRNVPVNTRNTRRYLNLRRKNALEKTAQLEASRIEHFTIHHWGNQVKEKEMGETRGTHGGELCAYTVWVRKPKVDKPLERLCNRWE
jgi:hypothetical protein